MCYGGFFPLLVLLSSPGKVSYQDASVGEPIQGKQWNSSSLKLPHSPLNVISPLILTRKKEKIYFLFLFYQKFKLDCLFSNVSAAQAPSWSPPSAGWVSAQFSAAWLSVSGSQANPALNLFCEPASHPQNPKQRANPTGSSIHQVRVICLHCSWLRLSKRTEK